MMSAIVNEAAPKVCGPVDRSNALCQLDFVELTVLLLSLYQKRPRDAVRAFLMRFSRRSRHNSSPTTPDYCPPDRCCPANSLDVCET
jgi:hypothetical protein